MDLSKDELEKIHNEENMLKGDINKMRLANSYEGLELNYMIAKDRIENIYKVACDHLHDKYDNEVEKKLKEEEEPDELEEMLRHLWNATVEDMRNEKFEEPKKEVESQESKDDWYDIPSDEMTLEQARQAVKDLRKKLAEYLEQEPCEDAISRQAVLKQINCWIGSGEYRYTNATDYLTKRIQAL